MPLLEKGEVKIWHEDSGSGFPLLLIPGGGLNSTISFFTGPAPFDPVAAFNTEYRCITLDMRNAKGGRSSGPLDVERPWDCHADDQLAVLDHLGIDRCMVMGFCIGGPLIWNLLRRAPTRFAAAVLAQPSGFRPELPDFFYNNNLPNWGADLCARRPDISPAMVQAYLARMYRNPDFVFTVTRDFVRACQTPILVLPDDVPAHPYAVAIESARLAPNAEVSPYPWKDTAEHIAAAVAQVRSFLRKHCPAPVAGAPSA